MKEKDIYIKAISKHGVHNQLDMVIEECAELIQEINKLKRNNFSEKNLYQITGEIVDVEIMLSQLKIILERLLGYSDYKDLLKKVKYKKLKRLNNLLKEK
jgi:NTP pyrophosphatase (non-canonical NTP hydrolase)